MSTASPVVIELGASATGQYCAYLLAGLGAEAIRVSASAASDELFTDANKAVVDTLSDDLLARADVVIDTRVTAEATDLSATEISKRNPAAVIARITWFGASGPYADRLGSELTAAAASGYLSLNGYADREPVKLYGVQGQRHAGLQAAIGVLAAMRVRDRTGQGTILDVSVQEAYVYLTAGAPLDYFHTGAVRRRAGNSQAASTRGQTYTAILSCADGCLLLGLVGARDYARLEQLFEMPLPDHMRERPGAFEAELSELCAAWLAPRRRDEVLRRAVELGLHWAIVNDMAEVASSAQIRARNFLVPQQVAGQTQLVPGRPVAFSAIEWYGRRSG